MKKKSALIFGLVLIIILSFGSGMVIGQNSEELPRVEVACESKAGLIHGFNDGFSILKKCPKGSRRVVLGDKSTLSNDPKITSNIVFIDREYVLLNDGTVWSYDFGGDQNPAGWYEATDLKITGLNVSDILDWSQYGFVTKQGNVYFKREDHWLMVDMSTLGK
jgi:hypothetical protein